MTPLDLGRLYDATEEDLRYGIGTLALADQPDMPVIAVRYARWSLEQLQVVREAFHQGLILVHGRRADGSVDLYLASPLAVFTGLKVAVDDCPCVSEPFVSGEASHHSELGCRIEVCEASQLSDWHRHARRGFGHSDNVIVNFHGQTTSFNYQLVSEPGLWFLVNLTGEPTGIRLMLPARTQLVENLAYHQLKAALELEGYRFIQRRGHHRLPYQQYLRARELGIELPEATPTFRVGLLASGEAPEPVEVNLPEGFTLDRCYRFEGDKNGAYTDEINVHLLAALGTFAEPFVPVSIRSEYDGYSWAKLPTIGKVALTIGTELQLASIWTGQLTCVDSLVITVQTSDGRAFSSPVCLAKLPPPDDEATWFEDHVYVTPDVQQRLTADQIWYHFGGWYDEGDTYETQVASFETELDRFWANLLGPDEQLRRNIFAAIAGLREAWQSVVVEPDGTVIINRAAGPAQVIRPPAA